MDHFHITADLCQSNGLPVNFCTRAAVAAHDVDVLEATELPAHAQMEEEQDACTAVDLVIARIQLLGVDLRHDALAVAEARPATTTEAAAIALGRALHTIQDNCTHQGMTNPEHAWMSRSDLCDGTEWSPDLAPAALECARAQTHEALRAFAFWAAWQGIVFRLGDGACPPQTSSSTLLPCSRAGLPEWTPTCEFLRSAAEWNGVARRWEHETLGAMLTNALIDAVSSSRPATWRSTCSTGSLEWFGTVPTVDVSSGPASCPLIEAACLGRADTGSDLEPTADAYPIAEGCSAAPSSSSDSGAWVGLIALLFVWTWQRRSRA